MTKAAFPSVDDYIASQPETAGAKLATVRNTIRKALPHAEEVIAYNMPAYKLHGKIVLYFAGWKQHYSLYPAGAHRVAALRQELALYKVDRGHDPLFIR
jgi:uncharacterized protein YdhG (YjbR/CyaY superfamily)